MSEKSELDMKKCPFCANPVKRDAIMCRFCRSALSDDAIGNRNKKGDSWECLNQLEKEVGIYLARQTQDGTETEEV